MQCFTNQNAQTNSTSSQGGFMLASVLLVSVALLIVASSVAYMVSAGSRQIIYNMFSQVAQTAAKSGIDYAKEQFVSSGEYSGTAETAILQNGRYRATFTVAVLNTSSDGLKKLVEATGRVYLPEESNNQVLVRSIKSEIIQTAAVALSPDVLSPLAWYDASDASTLHPVGSGTQSYSSGGTTGKEYVLNEKVTDGSQSNSTWNDVWSGLGYNSQLNSDVFFGVLLNVSGIPKGSTINSAVVKLVSYQTSSGSETIKIEAIAVDALPDGNQFTGPNTSGQLKDQTVIGDPVYWTLGDWPQGNRDQFTPELKDMVQAVLDQPGFDPDAHYIGLRFSRDSGTGVHRVKKTDATITINFTFGEDIVIADGQPVMTWDDKSGNGHNLVALSGEEPIYRTNWQNGLSMLDHTYTGGDGKYMTTSSFDLIEQAEAGTIFVIAQPDNGSGNDATLVRMDGSIPVEDNCDGNKSCNRRNYEITRSGSTDTAKAYIERTGNNADSALTATQNNIFSASGAQTVMLNLGVAYADGSCNPSLDRASLDFASNSLVNTNCPGNNSYPKSFKDGLVISVGNGRNGHAYKGRVGEVVIFDRQLSCREIQSLQKYARQKWFADNTDDNVISCPVLSSPGF